MQTRYYPTITLNDYAQAYGRETDNNFASSCYNDNSIQDLVQSLTEPPSKTDLKNWGIKSEEYYDALSAALNEKLADLIDRD